MAIIGILVSMLFLSLSRARLKSQQAVYLSNQKSMYPAIVIYTDNNKNILL